MRDASDPYAPMTPGWANRTPLLIGLILVLQLLFVWSYVGGLHQPTPKELPLGIVAGDPVFEQLQQQVSERTDAVRLVEVGSADEARQMVTDRELLGAYVIDVNAPTDTLLTVGVPSPAIEETFRTVIEGIQAQLVEQSPALVRPYSVEVLHPFEPGDPQGLTPFYLAIGWVVGGYLLVAFFGFTQRHVVGWSGLARRMAILVGYAVASGIGGAVLVGPVLGAFDGHLWALAAFGAALSLAVSTAVQAVELLLGPVYGTGAAIVAFVILGNPSAGGAFPQSFLPGFWEAIGPWLTTGMGVDGIRGIVYDTSGLGASVWRCVGYVAIAVVVMVAFVAWREHRDGADRSAHDQRPAPA